MRLRSLLFLLLACAPAVAGAQLADRPSLPSGDVNDWAAYYDLGIAQLLREPKVSQAAFAWASHLRPDRAEPLYARWIAFWALQPDRFEDYLRDDEGVLRDPRVQAADSLRYEAVQRNPFVHQGLVMFLYDQLPGRFGDDVLTRGWLALGNAQLPQATSIFGKLVDKDPKKFGYLRFYRASAFVNTHHSDSAKVEISALLAQLRAADAKRLGNAYQSKELLEYALGLLALEGGRTAEARDALGRAVAENAAFAPAHVKIAELASAARDTATAFAELTLAAEVAPNDAMVHYTFGKLLIKAGRTADGIAHLQTTTRLEPLYAEPYLNLAAALEQSGRKREAADAYARFSVLTLRDDPRRTNAEQLSTLLGSAPKDN